MVTLDAARLALWQRLALVRHVEFTSRGKATTGWNGRGTGAVTATLVEREVLVFVESGDWTPAAGTPTRFRNVYRWTLLADGIRLEHLRLGEDRPVYLFDLVPVRATEWRSDRGHECGP